MPVHMSCVISRTSRLAVLLTTALLGGCGTGQFTTVTILETPAAYVRLETDPTVAKDAGHSHPLTLTAQQVAAVLRGIMFEEPVAKLPIYDETSQPRRHQAFTEREVAFFAPLLAIALGKAMPEEIVTFYESSDHSAISRDVTSGGLYVQGEDLHVIVANYRSRTHYMADAGVADTTDDRLTPMRALAPQRGHLYFEPRSAEQPASRSWPERWLQPDRREVIVRYSLLPPQPATLPQSAPQPVQ